MGSDGPELGLGLQSNKSAEDYARIARRAEAGGFDVLTVFSDLYYQPPIFPLLVMAEATSRVRLGPACLNPFTLAPYEIAGQTAALDLASGGRAYLGLARGAWLGDVGIDQDRPITRLRETWEVVQRLLAGDRSGYTGTVFRLTAGARLRYPRQRPGVPLLLGTWGPRTGALAGEIADEVKVGGSANPAMVEAMRARIRPGAEAAGRSVDDVGVVLGAVTVVDRDGDAARERARAEVAMYLDVVAELDPTFTVPAQVLGRVRAGLRSGDAAEAGAAIPDEVLDRFAFAGTPEHVAAQAGAALDAGAARVEFGTPHGLTDDRGVALLSDEVVPLLR